eukprot:UN04447
MAGLDQSAVGTLIVFEELIIERITMKDTTNDDTIIKYLNKHQCKDSKNFQNKDGVKYDIVDRT